MRSWNCSISTRKCENTLQVQLTFWRGTLSFRKRAPMHEDMLKAAFAICLSLAFDGAKDIGWILPFAILMRLGFYALLRPGEMQALRAGDLRFVWSAGVLLTLCAIRDSKNKGAFGRLQFSICWDTATSLWLQWLIKGMPCDCRIWSSIGPRFREIFRRIMKLTGRDALGLTPASLRPGGTTFYFLLGIPIANIRYLGRWRSETSLSFYVQEVMVFFIWSQLDEEAEAAISGIIELSLDSLSRPPSMSWFHLFSRARQWQALNRRPQPGRH